ncbi:uncharacterized protein BJX67DRAFT_384023 [Aspergillus lucknowensis]|uniref:Mid2 domain-containing protein n=1 Tax=Aspergillus lucknowensis TaxID=176173 RepID=A0ABR4LI27_9EURO
MRIFNPVDSFDSFFAISRRQSDSTCSGGLGEGECVTDDKCPGVLYQNQCQHDASLEVTPTSFCLFAFLERDILFPTQPLCCLNHDCSTDVGDGWCRNRDNQTCEGEWVPGTGFPWPCIGPNYIVCCVRWEDMINGTSSSTPTETPTSSTSPSTSTTPTTTTGDNTPSPTGTGDSDSSSGSSGLTSAQKGGIAGGIVGAVAVTSIIFLLAWYLRRRKRRQAQAQAHAGDLDGGLTGDDSGVGTGVGAGAGEAVKEDGEIGEGDKGAAMLASREKQELDASGRALHEIDSGTPVTTIATPTSDGKGQMEEVRTRRLAELPGSLAVAEMPTPEAEPKP